MCIYINSYLWVSLGMDSGETYFELLNQKPERVTNQTLNRAVA